MFKYLLVTVIAASAIFSAGCGGTQNGNSNNAVKANTTPMPVETLEPPTTNTAPANAEPSPKGTPTPGVPDAANIKKGVKPGSTPTPGIPDAETMRRQMGQPPTNVNAPANNVPMMKSNRKTGGKIQ